MIVHQIQKKFPKVYAKLREQNVADHWDIESRSGNASLNFILRSVGLPEWTGQVKMPKMLKALERKLV